MRNQNAIFTRRDQEDLGIWRAKEVRGFRSFEINGGLTPKQARDDLGIQILIRQEARPHRPRLGMARLAASNLA
jgi:hypothetical protein